MLLKLSQAVHKLTEEVRRITISSPKIHEPPLFPHYTKEGRGVSSNTQLVLCICLHSSFDVTRKVDNQAMAF